MGARAGHAAGGRRDCARPRPPSSRPDAAVLSHPSIFTRAECEARRVHRGCLSSWRQPPSPLPFHLEQLLLRHRVRQVGRVRLDAHLFAGGDLGPDVGLRVAARADEHDGQARHAPRLLFQGRRRGLDLAADGGGDGFAVDDGGEAVGGQVFSWRREAGVRRPAGAGAIGAIPRPSRHHSAPHNRPPTGGHGCDRVAGHGERGDARGGGTPTARGRGARAIARGSERGGDGARRESRGHETAGTEGGRGCESGRPRARETGHTLTVISAHTNHGPPCRLSRGRRGHRPRGRRPAVGAGGGRGREGGVQAGRRGGAIVGEGVVEPPVCREKG